MQLAIADLFDVSQPTVCRVVHRVSEAVASLLPDFIHQSTEKSAKRCQGNSSVLLDFQKLLELWMAPLYVSCLQVVKMQKGFAVERTTFALNVQTIVDSDLGIRNVVARWPGSAHYSTVFNNSAACLSLKTNALYKDFHLLGDTAMHVKNIY
ncbi:nuclease HARBI1 [Trichonephila clavipes]|nr:nuclease HARBI1 [Trichonephila clavipes]